MAGVKKYSQIGEKFDGKSFMPLLRGKKVNLANREFFWHFPHFYDQEPYSVMRKGDWKLIYGYKESKLDSTILPMILLKQVIRPLQILKKQRKWLQHLENTFVK